MPVTGSWSPASPVRHDRTSSAASTDEDGIGRGPNAIWRDGQAYEGVTGACHGRTVEMHANPPGMILMLRVWMDGENADQLRARLTSSSDNMNTEGPVAATTGIDAIANDVRIWLERFCAESAAGTGPEPEASRTGSTESERP